MTTVEVSGLRCYYRKGWTISKTEGSPAGGGNVILSQTDENIVNGQDTQR